VQNGPTSLPKTGPPGVAETVTGCVASTPAAVAGPAERSDPERRDGERRSAPPATADPPRARSWALRFPGPLLFHRLAEAVTFAIHLEDVAAVRQPIQQRRRHPLPLEDLHPVPKGQVARHQQALALVALGEHLEQQLRPRTAERQVAQFVADQDVGPAQLLQEAFQLVLLLRLLQAVHQARRGEEPHPLPLPASGQAQ